MDLSKIDEIIESLEKKKSLRPGSPPEVVGGHLGVWRMIRGMRTFIELENDKKSLGNILVGPPSFVGHSLNNIPSDVWEAMTPRATMEAFTGVKASPNGVDVLKESIKNATGPNDTRRQALESLNTPEQLVPIARSAGFTDDNIKQALSGSAPNKPLENSTSRAARDAGAKAPHDNMPLPDNVVRLKPRAKPEAPAAPEEPQVSGAPRPEAPTPIGSKPAASSVSENVHQLEGALALSPEKLKEQGKNSKEENMADFLEKIVANKIKNDDLLKQRVLDLAEGLRGGKFTSIQVQDEVREITTNYARVKSNQFKPEERQALRDSARVKEFIDTFDQVLEDKVNEKVDQAKGKFKPASPSTSTQVSDSRVKELADAQRRGSKEALREAEKHRAEAEKLRNEAAASRRDAQEFMSSAQLEKLRVEAAIELLKDLSKRVSGTKAQKEVSNLISNVKKNSFSLRSILLSLYRLLQLILLLIPGL
jgi:uncharacterized membrane protein